MNWDEAFHCGAIRAAGWQIERKVALATDWCKWGQSALDWNSVIAGDVLFCARRREIWCVKK